MSFIAYVLTKLTLEYIEESKNSTSSVDEWKTQKPLVIDHLSKKNILNIVYVFFLFAITAFIFVVLEYHPDWIPDNWREKKIELWVGIPLVICLFCSLKTILATIIIVVYYFSYLTKRIFTKKTYTN